MCSPFCWLMRLIFSPLCPSPCSRMLPFSQIEGHERFNYFDNSIPVENGSIRDHNPTCVLFFMLWCVDMEKALGLIKREDLSHFFRCRPAIKRLSPVKALSSRCSLRKSFLQKPGYAFPSKYLIFILYYGLCHKMSIPTWPFFFPGGIKDRKILNPARLAILDRP